MTEKMIGEIIEAGMNKIGFDAYGRMSGGVECDCAIDKAVADLRRCTSDELVITALKHFAAIRIRQLAIANRELSMVRSAQNDETAMGKSA